MTDNPNTGNDKQTISERHLLLLTSVFAGSQLPPTNWLFVLSGKQLAAQYSVSNPVIASTNYLVVYKVDFTQAIHWLPHNQRPVLLSRPICFVECSFHQWPFRLSDQSDCHFYNCSFSELTFSSNAKQSTRLSFAKCAGTNILLSRCENRNLSILDNSSLNLISVDQSKMGDVAIKHSKVAQVAITHTTNLRNLNIDSSVVDELVVAGHCTASAVYLKNATIKQCNCLNHCTIDQIIVFDRTTLRDFSIYEHCKIGKLQYLESSGGQVVLIADAQVDEIQFNNHSMLARLLVNKNSNITKIAADTSWLNSIELNESNVKELLLLNSCASVRVNSIPSFFVNIRQSSVNVFEMNGIVSGDVIISDSSINTVDLSNYVVRKDAVIAFSNTGINRVILENFFVFGQMTWRGVYAKATVDLYESPDYPVTNDEIAEKLSRYISREESSIVKPSPIKNVMEKSTNTTPVVLLLYSSLGKTEINGVDLSKFTIVFRNTRLLDIFIAGTKLPPGIVIFHEERDEHEELEAVYDQHIFYFNQIKKVYESQGNVVDASWFHAEAMNYQEKKMALRYRLMKKRGKVFSEQAFDLFNIGANRISNRHGESWRKALAFAVVSTLFVYTIYFVSVHWCEQFDLSGTWYFLAYYFSFLDLTHKIDFMTDKVSHLSRSLDFFGRVVTGYAIYQLIAAFRRHGKKSGV